MKVNLDAHIPREDFEAVHDGDAPVSQTIDIKHLEAGEFFYQALRKPDFQRETTEWDPTRVVGLVQTFIEGDLVPAVILWKNKELLFVIDGSHRLSALIAWVNDDYGDGKGSQQFFNYSIPDDQTKAANRTRELINKEIGSYANHKDALTSPEKYGPDIKARARALGSRALQLQWVRGTAEKAEGSFIRINRKAVNITPQELELIEKRRRPQTIAARAIKSRGTGHKYWSLFPSESQQKIEGVAAEVHDMLFQPASKRPIDSLDLPPGGEVYSGPALRMVYDFIEICVGTVSNEDDSDGSRTTEYLTRCRRVMRLLLSRDPSSVGLHPAVYFYSWTGSQQPILFLALASLLIDLDQRKQLNQFTTVRRELEEFIFKNRMLLSQMVRKFGTKDSGFRHLTEFYTDVLDILSIGGDHSTVAGQIVKSGRYSYLQPDEMPNYEDTEAPTKMSARTRQGLVMKKLLAVAPRCGICGGFLPPQAISVDHKQRVTDGGSTTAENTDLSHPYCNTGFKESAYAKAR